MTKPVSINITVYYHTGSKYSHYQSKYIGYVDRSNVIKVIEDWISKFITDEPVNDYMYQDDYNSRTEIGFESIPLGLFMDYDESIGKMMIESLEHELKCVDLYLTVWIEFVHLDGTNLTN